MNTVITTHPEDEAMALLNARRVKFFSKFGREPGPRDSLFFNPLLSFKSLPSVEKEGELTDSLKLTIMGATVGYASVKRDTYRNTEKFLTDALGTRFPVSVSKKMGTSGTYMINHSFDPAGGDVEEKMKELMSNDNVEYVNIWLSDPEGNLMTWTCNQAGKIIKKRI